MTLDEMCDTIWDLAEGIEDLEPEHNAALDALYDHVIRTKKAVALLRNLTATAQGEYVSLPRVSVTVLLDLLRDPA